MPTCIELEKEKYVPFTYGVGNDKLSTLREQIFMIGKTEEAILKAQGYNDQDVEDFAQANELFSQIVESESSGMAVPAMREGIRTPVGKRLYAMLKTYDEMIIESSLQMRNYIVNRLIDESDNHDAKIRIKALELLGKVQDVGLFVEKTETKVIHSTDDELTKKLEDKLAKLLNSKVVSEQ